MTAKEKLIERVGALSDEQAMRMLDLFEDPVVAAFRDAPQDDEPLTPEEEDVIEQSRAEYRRGEGVPLSQLRHELS
jgi:hypothetical protein